jgi:carbon-monoxide dehydrogenase large subunit
MTAVYTNKAPGGVAYSCSFRVTEAVYLVERLVDCLAAELGHDPVELRRRNLLRPEQFPYTSRPGGSTTRATTSRPCARRCGSPTTTGCAASRPSGGRGANSWASASRSSPRRSGAGRARTWTSSGWRWPTGRAAGAPDRHRRAAGVVPDPGAGPRDDVRADRRRGDRHPPAPVTVGHGDTDQTPFGSARTAAAPRGLREPRRPRRRPQGPRQGPDSSPAAMLEVLGWADSEWEKGSFHVTGDPASPLDWGTSRGGAQRRRLCRTASRVGSRRRSATTLRI